MIIEEITRESYDWQDNIMQINQTNIAVIDSMRMNEICNHYRCDLSEFKEWLEIKRKEKQCKSLSAIDAGR